MSFETGLLVAFLAVAVTALVMFRRKPPKRVSLTAANFDAWTEGLRAKGIEVVEEAPEIHIPRA